MNKIMLILHQNGNVLEMGMVYKKYIKNLPNNNPHTKARIASVIYERLFMDILK